MQGRCCRKNQGWQDSFRGCGYRITVGREAILDVLMKSDKHLSAEDIYNKVQSIYPTVGLTSVYRTLELLVDMGFVYKFDFGDGRARYEIAEGGKKEKHHHHLVCTKCKKIVDYTDFIEEEVELLKKTEKGLSKKYNFEIKNYLIQFYGVCGTCSKVT